jgi:hypothetical protein
MLRLVDLNHVKKFISIYLEHIYENISPFNNKSQFTASCSSRDTDEKCDPDSTGTLVTASGYQ